MQNTIELRKCTHCKEFKPLTEENFCKDKNRPFGFCYRCKPCNKKRIDNRTAAQRKTRMSPEAKIRFKERQFNYNRTSKGRSGCQVKQYLKFDQERGFENDITKDDILKARESNCVYCGFPAIGLDRVDNSKGHTKENCVPACCECNKARLNHFTYDEMLIIGMAIKEVKLKRINT